jgi:nucleoside permease NupC
VLIQLYLAHKDLQELLVLKVLIQLFQDLKVLQALIQLYLAQKVQKVLKDQ